MTDSELREANEIDAILISYGRWVHQASHPENFGKDTVYMSQSEALEALTAHVQAKCDEARQLPYAKYRKLYAGLFAIKPFLDKPYPDDQRWTPWTRFVEPRLKMLSAAFKGEDIGELAAMAALTPQTDKEGEA